MRQQLINPVVRVRDRALAPNGVKVPTYLYKLAYDATTQRAWAH